MAIKENRLGQIVKLDISASAPVSNLNQSIRDRQVSSSTWPGGALLSLFKIWSGLFAMQAV